MARRGKDGEKLVSAVFILATKGILPIQYSAHKLQGEYEGCWECHVEFDWLLICYLVVQRLSRAHRHPRRPF